MILAKTNGLQYTSGATYYLLLHPTNSACFLLQNIFIFCKVVPALTSVFSLYMCLAMNKQTIKQTHICVYVCVYIYHLGLEMN